MTKSGTKPILISVSRGTFTVFHPYILLSRLLKDYPFVSVPNALSIVTRTIGVKSHSSAMNMMDNSTNGRIGHLAPLPIAAGNVVTQMQSVLSTTLNDLHIRNEVGDCIQEMLLDLETTHHLQQQLELESTQKLLEKAQTEQQGVTLEAHAERLERYDRRVELADQFVVELLQVNREMKGLLAWKEAHSYKVRNYDLILAKLAKTEADLAEANELASVNAAKVVQMEERKSENVVETPPVASEEAVESAPAEATEPTPAEATQEPTIETTAATTAAIPEAPQAEPAATEAETPAEDDQKPAAIPETGQPAEEDQKPAAAEVVSIDVEAVEEIVPTLVTLDVEPLMMIFGFLDAMDILNTAQINLEMYNKVDNIFGISEDGQTPPAPTPPPPRKIPAPPPKPPAVPPANATTTNTSAASSSTATGVMGGMFSMLQPAAPTQPATPKPPPASSSQQQSQPLNAKVAQSMASKLSDAELAAIISMTDKLSKLEKEVHMLKNEKEVMAGKLEGTEAVKQFLIGKVRDVEVKLQRSKEDEIKVTQQIASDQEVIAFLDSRVQELEEQTETLTLEKTGTQAGFDDLKVSSSKKITMLSDMLKYEREKLREDESDWKATKKVLVKEVKSCRAQILALQAERDGLKEQNDMLKRAIVSKSGGVRSPKS